MATTKKTEDQVKAAMAKVEAAKETTKKETEKKAPAKKTAAKAETKAAAEKKPVAAKTTEKKTTVKTAVKSAVKAATTKKAPAKKVTAKATQTVYIQCCGYEVTTEDVTAKVVEAVGKKTVKELNIYVKPEEGMVYYTADGEQGSIAL